MGPKYLAVMAVLVIGNVLLANAQKRFYEDCNTATMRILTRRRFVGGGVYKSKRLSAGSGTLDCANLCKGEEDCWSFNYEKNRKMCYLISSTEDEQQRQRAGSWSAGYRECTFNSTAWSNDDIDFSGLKVLCAPAITQAIWVNQDSSSYSNALQEWYLQIDGTINAGSLSPPSPSSVCRTDASYTLVCIKPGQTCSAANAYNMSDPVSFASASATGGADVSLVATIPWAEVVNDYACDAYAVAQANGDYVCSDNFVTIDNICFPSSATVQVLGRGTVRMDELNVGDKVLAATQDGKLEWSEVFFFGRRQADVTAQYHKLTTKGGELKMSSIHFVAAADDTNGWCTGESSAEAPVWSSHKMMLAKDVKPGMVLWQSSTKDLSSTITPSCVIANELITEEGAYDPFIRDRALIVDSFAASPHVRWTSLGLYWVLPTWMQPHLPAIYDVFMTPVYWFYKVMGAEFVNKLTQTFFFTGYLADQPLCRGGAFYCLGGNVMLATYIAIATVIVGAAVRVVKSSSSSSIGFSKVKKN